MSLTGKNISELTAITGYTPSTLIPVYKNGQTFKSTFADLEPVKRWRALLTQTGPLTFTGNSDENLYGGLIPNEIYTIDNYVPGDDFSNVAEVLAGTINTTGCVFKATGTTRTRYIDPDVWSGSTLTSDGNMIVEVLENTLGTNVTVEYPAFGSFLGAILFFPVDGDFYPRETSITVQPSIPYLLIPEQVTMLADIDRVLLAGTVWMVGPDYTFYDGVLNNTLVEITVNK
jgi:hypothetical protein